MSSSTSRSDVPTVSVCKDNTLFQLKDTSGLIRNCQKIGLSDDRDRICQDENVAAHCPITCEFCCEDDMQFSFPIYDGKYKSCAWISSDIDRVNAYCDMHTSGTMVRLACPKTCNYCVSNDVNVGFDELNSQHPSRAISEIATSYTSSQCIDDLLWRAIDADETTHTCRTITNDEMCAVFSASTYIYNGKTAAEACCRCGGSKYQSVNPPPADMSQCKNDDWFRYIGWSGEKFRSCKEIGLKEHLRVKFCKRDEVKAGCPVTCGLCCEDDGMFFFPLQSGKVKGCPWIGANDERKEKYCEMITNGKSIGSACPYTCGNCF